MRLILLVAVTLCVGVTYGQQYPTTTPVPILKQINRHNEDGSYSYGYEAADGSYKIESKYPTGEVFGKYGFVDDTGSLREIEYGASRRGFEPAGTGINVPPPTLHGNSLADGKDDPDDDGQYREDPSIYYTDPRYTNGERYDPVPKSYNPIYNHQIQQRPYNYNNAAPSKSVAAAYRRPAPAPLPAPAPAPTAIPAPVAPVQYRPEYQPQYSTQYQQPQYQPQPQYQSRPQYQPQPQYQQPQYPQPQYQPTQYKPQYYQQPAQYAAPNPYQGHAASNVNLNTGSYRINYKR